MLPLAERRALIVYASKGEDPRITTEWYPLSQKAVDRLIVRGWVRACSHLAYEATPAGRKAAEPLFVAQGSLF